MTDFVCGGGGALMAIGCVHPIDVVKTRQQFQGEAASSSSSRRYASVLRSIYTIGQKEGLRGLYRGLSAAACLQVSVTGVRFGVYDVAKRRLGSSHTATAPNHLANFLTAMLSGAIGACVGSPFFRLKTQMQTLSSVKELQVGYQNKQTGLVGAARQIISVEGVAGLYRGVDAMVMRVSMYSAVQLSVYDGVKDVLTRRSSLEGVALHAASSTITAVFAVTAMQPFDFVAARCMNQPSHPTTGRPLYYAGPADCFRQTVRTEGVLGLFKGGSANFMRMCPYTVLCFVFIEQLRSVAQQAGLR